MANNPNILAGRAIAGVMIQRYLFYPSLALTILCTIATAISAALVFAHSAWWVLLTILLVLWLIVLCASLALSFLIYRKISPRALSSTEKKQIITFIKDFGIRYAAMKGARKNPTTLAGIIAWRFIRRKDNASVAKIVTEPISDIKELQAQFQKIYRLFT